MQLILISEFILHNIAKILSSQHVVRKTLHMSYFTFCFYSKSLQSEAEFPVKENSVQNSVSWKCAAATHGPWSPYWVTHFYVFPNQLHAPYQACHRSIFHSSCSSVWNTLLEISSFKMFFNCFIFNEIALLDNIQNYNFSQQWHFLRNVWLISSTVLNTV